jgi:hypothetical protein
VPGDATAAQAGNALIARVRNLTVPGSRDRHLIDTQVLLSFDTHRHLYDRFTPAEPAYIRGSRPALEQAVAELTAGVRPGLATALVLTAAVSRLLPVAMDGGGDHSEEDVWRAGAATPLERARLLATMAQLAGIGSRICLLYRDAEPSFHAVCELRIMAAWSVFDPLANQYFVLGHQPYASAWDIKQRPAIVDRHPAHGQKPTVDSSFYRTVGIANIELAPWPPNPQ